MRTYIKIYQLKGSKTEKSRHVTLNDVTADQIFDFLIQEFRDFYSTSRPLRARDPQVRVSTRHTK